MTEDDFQQVHLPYKQLGGGTVDSELTHLQHDLWSRLFDAHIRRAQNLGLDQAVWVEIRDQVNRYLDRVLQSKSSVAASRAAGPRIAILNKALVEQYLRELPTKTELMDPGIFMLHALAAAIHETARVCNPPIDLTRLGAETASEVGAYSAWSYLSKAIAPEKERLLKAIVDFRQNSEQEIGDVRTRLSKHQLEVSEALSAALADSKKRVSEALAELERQNEPLAGTIARQDLSLADLDQRYAALFAKSEAAEGAIDALKQMLEKDEQAIANHRGYIEATLNGLITRQLWKARAQQSGWAFWSSALLLVVFLIVFPVCGFIFLETILRVIAEIAHATAIDGAPKTDVEVAAQAVSRLIVLTLPIGLYLWVIRLLVRFNTRSMLLMDDARQRQTIMDTYEVQLKLTEMSKEERGLLLAAMFRPPPGHGADNVEPPDFTDFIGKIAKP